MSIRLSVMSETDYGTMYVFGIQNYYTIVGDCNYYYTIIGE